jgi:hypothetical protein
MRGSREHARTATHQDRRHRFGLFVVVAYFMTFAIWMLVIGALLITITLSGTSLQRLPLSTAITMAPEAVLPGRQESEALATPLMNLYARRKRPLRVR